jgi:hypothetical protein
MKDKKFGYWEILFLIIITFMTTGVAVAFNVPIMGSAGLILYLGMWFTRSE